MSADIYKIHERTRRLDDDGNTVDHEGACPVCGRSDGFINIRKQQWGGCRRHKVRWLIGLNVYSGWMHQNEADWQKNADMLSGWREVKPVFPQTYKVDDPFVDVQEQP